MKKIYLFIMLLSFACFLIGCTKDGETGGENNPENPTESEIPEEFKDSYLDTTIQVDGVNAAEFYKGCYVNSTFGEVPVSNGSMKLQSNINKKVQTYFLTDGGDKIYQMTRVSDTEKNKKIDFTAESTALAFVTFHPLFASIDSVAYDILEEAILQSENFPKVRTEINNLIKQKKDLYSENNTPLFDALDSLLDELVVFVNYKPTEEATSRSIKNETLYYPFKINSSGNRLDFQVFGLNPNYYGTATHADGSTENLVVESHEDFGLLAFLESFYNILKGKDRYDAQYGNIKSYNFPSNGECKFHFSCKTKQNEEDLALRILASICEMLGIDETLFPISIAGNLTIIRQEIQNSSYELAMSSFPFYSVVGQVGIKSLLDATKALINKCIEQSFEMTIDYYEKEKMTYYGQKIQEFYDDRLKALKNAQSRFKNAMKTYTLTKGIANIAFRLIAAQKASDPVDFKFCCYNGEVHYCSQLWKSKGDNQTGLPGEKLNQPIEVALNVDMGNHSAYVLKFEVCKGGGTVGESGNKEEYVELGDFDNVVSTIWRLGFDSQEQMVRVSLCEKETKEVVCEPVEFTANTPNIYIVSGNNQTGQPNKTLPETLQVGLENYELFDTSNFRIQFDVVEGSGSVTPQYAELSGGIAECTWFLGNQDEKQKVKAVLVSSLTYKNISEPIYFEAKTEDKKEKTLREALIELYESTNGDNWISNSNLNWCSDKPIWLWAGIKQQSWGYIIDLAGFGLTGKIEQTFPSDVKIALLVNNNNLTSVNVSGSTAITDLCCYENPITSLEVVGCTALNFLDCCNNQLTSLNVSSCTSLATLFCGGNQLTSLNISGCTSLVALGCGGNQLTSLNISGCTTLTELNCYNNRLTSLNVSGCTSLEDLFCPNNQIVSFNVEGCVSLKNLSCHNNNIISEIPSWFSQLKEFSHDIRYEYSSFYKDGYKDKGKGWWYPGEPEKGYHWRE